MSISKNVLWWRWTIANGLAELVVLGGTFVVIGLLFSRIDTQQTSGILLAFVVAIASGAIEATIVDLAQWWAMQPWFPLIGRFAWWRATLVGALLAYGLGYLPSTLMSMGKPLLRPRKVSRQRGLYCCWLPDWALWQGLCWHLPNG
jgi:hypothetical protein